MNTIGALAGTVTSRTNSAVTRAIKRQTSKDILRSMRGRELSRSERQLMELLIRWHDPLTGFLRYRTRALNITEELGVTERTLARTRKGLIARGLIVGYEPGSGHRASTYAIARSWEEADQAVKLREDQGENAPYFPELPDRSVPTRPGEREMPPVEEAAPEPEPTPEEVRETRVKRERVRLREAGVVKGPIPPTLAPAWELPELVEAERRKAEPGWAEGQARGMAEVRASLELVRRNSGAA